MTAEMTSRVGPLQPVPLAAGLLINSPQQPDLVADDVAEALQHHALSWHQLELREGDLLKVITQVAAQLIPGADGAAILGFTGPGQLEVRAAHGALSALLPALHHGLDSDMEPPADLPADLRPMRSAGTAPMSNGLAFTSSPGIFSGGTMICAPLGQEPTMFGTLVVLAGRDGAFTGQARSAVTILAMRASVALTTATRRDAVSDAARRSRAPHDNRLSQQSA